MEFEKRISEKLSLISFEEFLSRKMDGMIINSQQEAISYYLTNYFEFIKFIKLIELSRSLNLSNISKQLTNDNSEQSKLDKNENKNEKDKDKDKDLDLDLFLSISAKHEFAQINLEYNIEGSNEKKNNVKNVNMNLIIFSILNNCIISLKVNQIVTNLVLNPEFYLQPITKSFKISNITGRPFQSLFKSKESFQKLYQKISNYILPFLQIKINCGSKIKDISLDILCIIFSYFNLKDLILLHHLNYNFYKKLEEEELWEKMYKLRFGPIYFNKNVVDWKRAYIHKMK